MTMIRILTFAALLPCTVPVFGGTVFPNSLWVGGQGMSILENVDQSGNVLRSLTLPGTTEAKGIGVDPAHNRIYVHEGNNSVPTIVTYDLTTLSQLSSTPYSAPFLADLTFDGSSLWGASPTGPGNTQFLYRIDPLTGNTLQTLSLGTFAGGSVEGVASDGSGFWVSFEINGGGGVIQHFALDGTAGSSFNVFGPLVNIPVGVGYDPTNNTLWVGALGVVEHYTTGGALLGSFAIPSNVYAQGVEFEGTAPEPGTFLLAGIALLSCIAAPQVRRKRRQGSPAA